MSYLYLAHLKLQLHMQYQPRSDMFAHSPTTITTPSMVKPTASHHHQPPPTAINSHKHQQQSTWPQECHVTHGFGCRQPLTCVEGPWTKYFYCCFCSFWSSNKFFLLFLGYLLLLQWQHTTHAYALLPIQMGCKGGWLRLRDPREVPGGPGSQVPTR